MGTYTFILITFFFISHLSDARASPYFSQSPPPSSSPPTMMKVNKFRRDVASRYPYDPTDHKTSVSSARKQNLKGNQKAIQSGLLGPVGQSTLSSISSNFRIEKTAGEQIQGSDGASDASDFESSSNSVAGTTTPSDSVTERFPYGEVPVRGVNLGGWLVLECWMVPSLCASANDSRVVDEWTFGLYLGRENAAVKLQNHWATWITEHDFALIAKFGLNHVRIPFGYWGLDISQGEPYIQGSFYWLLQAVNWAKKYGIKVMIDLHGAPGSQNGYDNSGHRGSALWDKSQQNLNRTTAVHLRLAQLFSKPEYQNVVASIELLNEPAPYKGVDPAVVKSWYYQGYQAVRYAGKQVVNSLSVVIHDAFLGLSAWTGYMQPPQWQNVLLDTHIYVVFDKRKSNFTDGQLKNYYCSLSGDLETSNQNIKTIVGEWSPARTDCAAFSSPATTPSQYAKNNGGQSACLGKTRALGPLDTTTKLGLKKSFLLQTAIYETFTSGWILWSWKQEVAQEWSYFGGVTGGWIPRTLPAQMTNPCSSVS